MYVDKERRLSVATVLGKRITRVGEPVCVKVVVFACPVLDQLYRFKMGAWYVKTLELECSIFNTVYDGVAGGVGGLRCSNGAVGGASTTGYGRVTKGTFAVRWVDVS